MQIKYPEIGICGLSCRLCPRYHTEGKSKCGGCKTESRMVVGCPFITCAVKKKGIEFCWQCEENKTCERWRTHREFGRQHDTFKSYETLEDDIAHIHKYGIGEFQKAQETKERLLRDMLREFNEGRSKNYYCVAATVLKVDELKGALDEARQRSKGLDMREKSKLLHSILDSIAKRKNFILKLRK